MLFLLLLLMLFFLFSFCLKKNGKTALHLAVANRHLQIAMLLIEEGKADVDCLDQVGISKRQANFMMNFDQRKRFSKRKLYFKQYNLRV